MTNNNHPNRAWRRRMHDACAAWLGRWPWPDASAGAVLSSSELIDVMGQAYRAGYAAGRESTNPSASLPGYSADPAG